MGKMSLTPVPDSSIEYQLKARDFVPLTLVTSGGDVIRTQLAVCPKCKALVKESDIDGHLMYHWGNDAGS